ncbi:MAG: hypothetical protein ACPGSO_00620 [Vicingaceae bacterium]
MSKVKESVALNEVNKWLEFKKLKPSKVESSQDSIKVMAEAIQLGILSIDENFVLKHKLEIPIESDSNKTVLSELNYKPRLRISDVHPRLEKVKTGDIYGMVTAYISALTDQNTGFIKLLDTEDYRLAQSIATFFL